MEFIVNEELFNFLNIKYTVRNAKMAKVMMDKLNCSLGNFVYEKDYQLKHGFENKREEKL